MVHTQEEQAKIIAEWPRIKYVNSNDFAWQRLNDERQQEGLTSLAEENITPPQQEILYESPSSAPFSTEVPAVAPAGLPTRSLLPSAVDNSKTIWFPPIGNQEAELSCVTFATTYYQLSYAKAKNQNYAITHNGVTDYTKIFSPKWTYNMVNGGLNNGSTFYANYDLLQYNGAPSWLEFPYDGINYKIWPTDAKTWKDALFQRTAQVAYLSGFDGTPNGLQQLKQLLANGYIVSFGTWIYHFDSNGKQIWDWHFSKIQTHSGVSENSLYAGQQVATWVDNQGYGHAMIVVGYDDKIWVDINGNGVIDSGEMGALKIANSWGTLWGNNGFTWLAYDALNAKSKVLGWSGSNRSSAFSYGISSNQVYYIDVKKNADGSTPYTPKLIAQFTVNQSHRNLLGMNLGISSTTSSSPSTTWNPYALRYLGGAFAFNGSSTTVNGNFVLDFTDILPTTLANNTYYLGMDGGSNSYPSVLKSYQLFDLSSNTTAISTNVPLQTIGSKVYAKINYTYHPMSVSSRLTVNASGGRSTSPTITQRDSTVSTTLSATASNGGLPFTTTWSESNGPAPVVFAHSNNLRTVATFSNPGTYVLTITVFDGVQEASSNITVTVLDGVPPTINLTNPKNGDKLSNNLQVNASVWDYGKIKSVQFYLDGTLIAQKTASPYTFAWNTTNIPQGSHSLYATAFDTAGNAAASATITVKK